jgi:hypothetical protein
MLNTLLWLLTTACRSGTTIRAPGSFRGGRPKVPLHCCRVWPGAERASSWSIHSTFRGFSLSPGMPPQHILQRRTPCCHLFSQHLFTPAFHTGSSRLCRVECATVLQAVLVGSSVLGCPIICLLCKVYGDIDLQFGAVQMPRQEHFEKHVWLNEGIDILCGAYQKHLRASADSCQVCLDLRWGFCVGSFSLGKQSTANGGRILHVPAAVGRGCLVHLSVPETQCLVCFQGNANSQFQHDQQD